MGYGVLCVPIENERLSAPLWENSTCPNQSEHERVRPPLGGEGWGGGMSLKIIKPMGMVVCHDAFQWHPHSNPPPSKKKGGVRCASLSDMKQSLHASRDMAQANGLTPFDFNRNAQNARSRLVPGTPRKCGSISYLLILPSPKRGKGCVEVISCGP